MIHARRLHGRYHVALLALLSLGFAFHAEAAPRARASAPARPPIATIGDRRVEEADIRRAALVLQLDPLRTRKPAAWRQKLLDLCTDRELLAMEAERQGLLRDDRVRRVIDRRSADFLYGEIHDRYLVPEITPTQAQIDTARAGGLFRRVHVRQILSLTDRASTYKMLEAARAGASFDSLARTFSALSSAQRGGDVGWKYVGELNASSWKPFQTAKPGDLMGPYPNGDAHELYKVEAIVDPDDKEIRDRMMRDRLVVMEQRYYVRLLQKYKFALNPDAVSAAIYAAATEKVDTIAVSLDERGWRPKRGAHPALGTLARVDGDSISYRDLILSPNVLNLDEEGKAHMDDSRSFLSACTAAFLPRLILRDARERGVDRDPAIARRLRLIEEEASTRAMVAQAVSPPDSAQVRAYFEAHASSFQRPAARRALVAVFASEDTARAALRVWGRPAARDSVYALAGFRAVGSTQVPNLFPRRYGEISVFDRDQDPVSAAVSGLKEGEISSLIPTPNGYAVAQALGSEAARPYRFDEVRVGATAEAREQAENTWVMNRLERLRAATPPRTVPARLSALQLGMAATGGNGR